MGNSAPPPASIDLIGSFARRRGPNAEMVLWAPTKATNATSIVLARKSRTVEGTVQLVEDDQGRRLVASVPSHDLQDGQWSLSLRTPEGTKHKVQARLLVQGPRPLVLLWGGKAPVSEKPKPATAASMKRRVVIGGGSAVDSALRVLPAEQAVTVRRTLRRTARRLLG